MHLAVTRNTPLARRAVARGAVARSVLVAALMLAHVTRVRAQDAQTQASLQTAAASLITSDEVLRHLGTIAHDSMRGRDTPSRGLELTAAYIAAQFKAYGLQPAGDSGTFIQRYPYVSRQLDTTQRLIWLKGHDEKFNPAFGRDFFVVPSDEESVQGTPYYAGVVDANFTIPDGVKAPIIIGAIPDTIGPAWGERFNILVMAAATAGANGVVIALDPRVTADAVKEIAIPASEQLAPVTVFAVRLDALAPLLALTGIDAHTVFATAPNAVPARPKLLNGNSLYLSTATSQRKSAVPNVVAVLRGSHPALRDEYIVFSAHMDHVGVGAPDADNDSIYNGADDDGSGTTAIVALAHAFASLKTPPDRSMIFLTVSGEEKGLLGSTFFVDHLPVPGNKIVADINIDMIGRNNADSVTAIGLDYTSIGAAALAVVREHTELGLTVADDMQPEEHLFERSDHFNFAKKDIPAIFLTSGLHRDYHRPSDEIRNIDADKIARVARLAFYLGNVLANTRDRPSWTAKGRAAVKAARGWQ